MKADLTDYSRIASATLAIPVVALAWMFMVPSLMTAGTFAATGAVVIGAGAVALKTWRSGQATGTIGQVINDAEVAVSQPAKAPGRKPRSSAQ